uniref:Uncharacterized protein n=1 Tax=Glossina brevipalpis TaxID=37001 RepID=A0A1A9WQ63_9MUSC
MKISVIILAILGVVCALSPKHQKVRLSAYQQQFPIPGVFQNQHIQDQQQTTYNQKAVHGYQTTAYNPQNSAYNQQNAAYNLFNKQNMVYGSQKNQNTKYANKDFLAKQKFLFEIVYRVEDPLMFEEWIQLAQTATFNPSEYTPQAIEFIGNVMQGNVDVYDQYFFRQWNMFTHMYLADVEPQDNEVFPNIFVNFETMMRDPLFYSVYKKIADVYFHFQYYIKPYTQQELLFPGVAIKNVQVTDLVTYFDLVDFDVTNLLNDKMTFVDGQFVWDKTLLARQARLNHKPYTLEFTIESDKPQPVVIRTFLGPKYDEFGRTISIIENQQNFIEHDQFIHTLTAGVNSVQRNSQDFQLTIDDRTTFTELYKQVMQALEDKDQFPMDISQPHCGFPDRLALPRGWAKGMPMQLLIFVSPFNAANQPYSTDDTTCSCGIRSDYADQKPLGYPLDRIVDELEFFVPNMYLKDVKIYHADAFRKNFKWSWLVSPISAYIPGTEETSKQALLEYPRFYCERSKIEAFIDEPVIPRNLIRTMVGSLSTCNCVQKACVAINTAVRKDEHADLGR